MGIVKGDTETTINPQGDLTREQAAKLVTYAAVGATVAEKLSADTDPFDDVAATRWSAGYISYCVSAGIINGDGNGKFRPTDNVTGYEFAKMMLCVLGYGKNSEYTGKSWSVNVAKDALSNSINLFDGVLVAANNEPINREQAFQVVYNTLTGPAIATYFKSDDIYQSNLDEDGNNITLAETVFGFAVDDEAVADDFGRPLVQYTNGKDGDAKVVYATVEATPVLTYTGVVKGGKIFTDLGLTLATQNVAAANISVVVDGEEVDGEEVDGNVKTFSKGGSDEFGVAGSSVEVYKSGTSYTVVVIETHVKQLAEGDIVAAVAATDSADAIPAYIKVANDEADDPTDDGVFVTDAYKANDVILYTVAGDTIKTVEKATAVSGTASKYTATSVTVNGTAYTIAGSNTVSITPAATLFTTAQTYYVDANNNLYLIGAADEATVEIDGYFYVLGTQIKYTSDQAADLVNGATEKSAVVKAKVVDLAGKVSVIDLAVTSETSSNTTKLYYNNTAGDKTEITEDVDYKDEVACWAGYTVENGKYTIVAAATYAANAASVEGIEINKAAVSVGGKYVTSKSTLTIINVADSTVKTVTGVSNMVLDSSTVFATYASATATTVDALYVVQTESAIEEDTATYAFAALKGATVQAGTEWTFYIDGETKPLPVNLPEEAEEEYDVTELTAGNVYDLRIEDGVVTGAKNEVAVASAEAEKVTVVDDLYIVAGGNTYTYATAGCKVFNVTTGTPGTADTIEVGDSIVVAVSADGAASLIYIVK
jgi:hypothetical protein